MCVFPLTQFILAALDTEANDGLQPPAGQAVFAQSEALRGEKGAISSIPNAFISSNLTGSWRKKTRLRRQFSWFSCEKLQPAVEADALRGERRWSGADHPPPPRLLSQLFF